MEIPQLVFVVFVTFFKAVKCTFRECVGVILYNLFCLLILSTFDIYINQWNTELERETVVFVM